MGILNFINKSFVITELEIRKIFHDPTEIITRAVQPALWLLIFGQVFARLHAIPGQTNYIDFMTPGILAQSVLFVSIFSGIAIIWERDLGLVHKLLATPTPRTAIVLGKALSAGIRTLPIVVIIFILGVLLGVHIVWNPLNLLGVLIMVMLGAIFFSTFSLIIACLVKTRERFMGIGQLMTMPLFFASNAIYPIDIMPGWLKVLAHVNPLTYMVDALRTMMTGTPSTFNLPFDFGILFVASTILVIIGGSLYSRVIT
ncbi:multidrug ABC transporter permease [Kaistella flava (ex Peng et al. 2021)]|uniref:Transport permease protein n=1 Tax=Kaistella flava (ex Peng et al. 2021) TaxID=2038776 RepID=A0A7M2Y7C2_9FLAO|nr:ABC transporter permease [Kaistella flava (ex Peng et al. 2021)]QOW09574.1 multidrug ABC transporter permease [Kaistella flava (ex Peng et al. 2021)]